MRVLTLMLGGLVVLLLATTGSVQAQMVTIDGHYVIQDVHPDRNEMVVVPAKGDPTAPEGRQAVLIKPSTRVLADGRRIDWRQLSPGTTVRIKGGMTWDLKISAERITIAGAGE